MPKWLPVKHYAGVIIQGNNLLTFPHYESANNVDNQMLHGKLPLANNLTFAAYSF